MNWDNILWNYNLLIVCFFLMDLLTLAGYTIIFITIQNTMYLHLVHDKC